MSLDGIVLNALTGELDEQLSGARVAKIYQPATDELVFHIRRFKEKHQLLISVNAQFSRMHLTDRTFENPKEPPMFCMLLRKHLEGSVIETVKQVGYERIVHIHFRSKDEIGDTVQKILVVELMGKHSNVILINKQNNQIYDSIKHLSPSVNRHRTVLPGHEYIAPPEQNKYNPSTLDTDTLVRAIDWNGGKLDRQLVGLIEGFSPLLTKEILFRAGLPQRDAIISAFQTVQTLIQERSYTPLMVKNRVSGKDVFHVINLSHLKGESTDYQTCNALLDNFYREKAIKDLVKQKTNDLRKYLTNEKKKNEAKISKLKETMKKAEKADDYQLYGELLTANMHLTKFGDEQLVAINYYDPNQKKVTIPLDPNKSPSQNAQIFFKRYNKSKTAAIKAAEQLEETKQEIRYLDTLIHQLEAADLSDIEEIREELREQGYLKKQKAHNKKKKKQNKPALEDYRATDGTPILVGKNNKQNEYLTMKVANSDDTWLHTKDIPGSHVVVRTSDPSDETLMEAAHIAAFFSKSKLSGSVPVDYTLIKHVRKPNGAKPGFVIYEQQKTLFVTPDHDLVNQLRHTPRR